jgi:hypothetical protein
LIYGAVGFNERAIYDRRLMRSYLFVAAYQYNIRNTHKFSLGADIFLDENYVVDYKNEFFKEPSFIEQFRVGARVGYSYNVGRVSFPIEIGYYVFQKSKPDGYVVNRLGVRYYAANGLVGHFGLRTHFAVAYTFEYGLGYRVFL